ncbi:MAG: type II secretion system protein [Deltaproteobacteria bacterium]|nr:type II secretion system protein [Deltaproteobacteria bacterium]
MRGFSLIESVLSMTIIAAGFIGIVTAFQGSAQSSLLADQTITATYLASGTLDRIFARRDTNGYTTTVAYINAENYDQNPVSGFSNYVLTATALEVDPDADAGNDDFLDSSPSSGYARVTVSISWDSGARSISLASLITDY